MIASIVLLLLLKATTVWCCCKVLQVSFVCIFESSLLIISMVAGQNRLRHCYLFVIRTIRWNNIPWEFLFSILAVHGCLSGWEHTPKGHGSDLRWVFCHTEVMFVLTEHKYFSKSRFRKSSIVLLHFSLYSVCLADWIGLSIPSFMG